MSIETNLDKLYLYAWAFPVQTRVPPTVLLELTLHMAALLTTPTLLATGCSDTGSHLLVRSAGMLLQRIYDVTIGS